MAHGRDKYQSRENRARVRDVLMREWDPIGVAEIPAAADEYDAYASKAYVMLMDERATEKAISAYLFKIATRHMGLWSFGGLALRCNIGGLVRRSNRAAKILVAMRAEFEAQ
jgi:hypothetical protein